MSTQTIYNDLVATLGDKAVAYGTVTKCLHKAKSNNAQVPSNSDAISPHLDASDRAILAALEEKPF
jgi:hypothetical protein